MNALQAILLGVVQGITEFLPISSSGHLIFFPALFGWEQQAADFDVMIHVATLIAILWVMRKDVQDLVRGFFSKKKSSQLGWMILVASIPAAAFGLYLSDSMLADVRNVRVVAISLILWGAVLSAADFYVAKIKPTTTNVQKSTWKQAFVIGFAQAIALIPGTSRSGITMTFGLFSGQDRQTAARFSFLLAIPVIAGAGLFTALDAVETGGFSTPIPVLAVGFLSALISGAVSIKFLLKFLQRANFQWFAAYRVLLGFFIFLFLV